MIKFNKNRRKKDINGKKIITKLQSIYFRELPDDMYIYSSKHLIDKCKLRQSYFSLRKNKELIKSVTYQSYKTAVFLMLNYFLEECNHETFKGIYHKNLAEVGTENIYKAAILTLKRAKILCVMTNKNGKEVYSNFENNVFFKHYKLNSDYTGNEIVKHKASSNSLIRKYIRYGKRLFYPKFIFQSKCYVFDKRKIVGYKKRKLTYLLDRTSNFEKKAERAIEYTKAQLEGDIFEVVYMHIKKKRPPVVEGSTQFRVMLIRKLKKIGYKADYAQFMYVLSDIAVGKVWKYVLNKYGYNKLMSSYSRFTPV